MDYSTVKGTITLIGFASMYFVPKFLKQWNPFMATWIVWTITIIITFIIVGVGGEIARHMLVDSITTPYLKY